MGTGIVFLSSDDAYKFGALDVVLALSGVVVAIYRVAIYGTAARNSVGTHFVPIGVAFAATAGSGNDDASVLVDISSAFPDGLDYFGSNYTDIYVNSNGLITFVGPETSYSPVGLAGYSDPAIAPFWTDIDIENGGEIYWDGDDTTGTVTVTWVDVRPYTGWTETNSFQLGLTDTGGGNIHVEFIYEDIDFTDGGYGTAIAGLTDGGSNDFEVDGSGNDASVANWDTTDFDGPDR